MPDIRTPNFGPWGRLPADKLLPILAAVDAPTLRAAECTCRSWRALIREHNLWREQFFAFEDVCATAKWRFEELDKAHKIGGDNATVEKEDTTRPMPAGDGRGVSGPLTDTATLYTMALHSKWAAEFEEEVISKLASDDPLRAQIFDDNGVVREPVVPKATSLVYQWGTRLDKPDWRELAVRHLQTRANWLADRVVSSVTVPLRLPLTYKSLHFLGADLGDDAFFFSALTVEPVGELEDRDAHERTLICVERTTGTLRYVVSLPFTDVNDSWKFVPNVGLQGDCGQFAHVVLPNGKRPNCRSFISGRAFNHLCKDFYPKLPRNGYLQAFDDFPRDLWWGYDNFDLDNCGSHLDIAAVLDLESENKCRGRWETLSKTTAKTFDWKVTASTRRKPNTSSSMYFTDKYMFVDWLGEDIGMIGVCTRDTGDFVLDSFMSDKLLSATDTLQGAPGPQDAERLGFVYHLNESEHGDVPEGGLGKPGRETRRFELCPLRTDDESYREFFTDLRDGVPGEWDQRIEGSYRYKGKLSPEIVSVAVTKGGPGIFRILGGYIIIPRMQTVLDGARKVPFKARADFITRHSIVLITGLGVAELVNDTVLLRSDYDINVATSSLFVLDLELLPDLSQDMVEPPKLSGRAILQSNPEGWFCFKAHVFPGYILEILREVEEPKSETSSQVTYWLDWLDPCNTMLRITSFVPEAKFLEDQGPLRTPS